MPAVIRIQIEGTNGARGALDDAAKGINQLDDAARKGGGGFSSLKEIATGALREIGAAAVNIAAQGAQALAGFAKDSIDAAATFEASINGLAAVTGTSLADAGFSMDDVSAKALQLGKDTQFSAQEAIQAMTELAKGGVPVQSVMTDATDATLALAAASGVNLAGAAEIVAKQLGVWSETGVTAAQVTDLLAGAANASTVGVEDLALGLAQAGGTAKTAGVSFDEMVQTMAMIAPNFSSAADAGTSYKTFLSRLVPTTKPAIAAMQELGLMAFDTAKAMEVLKTRGFDGTESVDAMAAAIENVGVEMGLSGEKLKKFTSGFNHSAFYDATGSFIGMEAAAELLQNATSGLTEEQRLLAFQTIFGADAIRAAAAIANAGAEGYNAMGEAIVATGGATAAAAAKQQGYAFAMEQFGGSVETAQIILGTMFLPALTSLISIGTEVVNVVAGWIEAFGKMVPAIQASATPFTTFLNAVAVAIPGSSGFIQQLIGVVNQVTPVVQAMAANAIAGFQMIAGFVQANGPTIAATVIGAFQSIASFIQTVMPAITSIVTSTLVIMQGVWTAHGATILQVAQGTWQAIQGVIQVVFGAISGLLAIFAAAFTGDYTAAMTQVQQSNETIWTGISNFFSGILNIIAAGFGTSLEGIASLWKSNLDKLPVVAKTVMDAALVAFRTVLAQAPSIGAAIIDGIKSGLVAAAGRLASAAAQAAKSALDAAKGALGIKSPSSVFADEVGTPIAQGMAAGIVSGAGVVAGAAQSLAQQAVSGAQSALAAAGQGLLAAASGGGGGGGGSPASPRMVSAAADVWGRAGGTTNNSRSTTNNFNMSVKTGAKASTVVSDFGMMRALAGVA